MRMVRFPDRILEGQDHPGYQDGSSLTKNVRKWKNGLELTRNYTMFQKVSDEDPLPDIYLNDVKQPLIEIILFPDSGKV